MGSINWARVALVTLGLPIVVLAAVGIVVIAGDLEFRTLTNQLWNTVLDFGERIAYGLIAFVAVGITYLATRWQRDRWWRANGSELATAVLQDRYRQVRRERNAFEYRLKVRTEELREEQVRNRGAREMLEAAAMACGRAQIALRAVPAKPLAEVPPVLRRVN